MKEPNLPDGYECISTYYPSMDRLEIYDANHFVRCECDKCFKSFWTKTKFLKKITKCPYCGK